MTQPAPTRAQTPAFRPAGTVLACLVAFVLSFYWGHRLPLPPPLPPPPPPPVEVAVTPTELEVESSEEAELRRLIAWECARFREEPVVCKGFFAVEPSIPVQPETTLSPTSHRCPCHPEPPPKTRPVAPPAGMPKAGPPHPVAGYVAVPSFIPDGGAGRVALPSFIPDGGAGRVALPSFVPDGGAGRVALPNFTPARNNEPTAKLDCWCPDIPLPTSPRVTVKAPWRDWPCTCGPNQTLMCSAQAPPDSRLTTWLPIDISPLCDLSVTR
jgi:hypothetical protein